MAGVREGFGAGACVSRIRAGDPEVEAGGEDDDGTSTGPAGVVELDVRATTLGAVSGALSSTLSPVRQG